LASLQGLLSVKGQDWDTLLALPGCETIAPDSLYAWVFAYDRRAALLDTLTCGRLYHLRAVEESPFLNEVTPPGRWHPFGLAYRPPHLWFLHGPVQQPTEVWRYRWDGGHLHSPRVWRHPGFVSLQAIEPLDSVRFYVANDRKGRHRWHLVVGFFVRRVRSSLYYCEGDTCHLAADRIPYASGLCYLPSQGWLVVSVAFRRALWLYAPQGNRLAWIGKVRLAGYPDNLTRMSDSTLWVVCHRRLGGWARSLAFGGARSSWSIVEVRFAENRPPQTRLLYAAPKRYSTASQAVVIGPYIYVGSVFEPYLLRLKAAEAIPADALPASTSGTPRERPPEGPSVK